MSKGAAYYEAYWAIPPPDGRNNSYWCQGRSETPACREYIEFRMNMLAR